MKTRIVGGGLKGLFLDVPKTGTRPTMSKVRGAIFSSLLQYLDFEDLDVLDLYAGSGSLGFESISRGARSVLFIDNAREALSVLKRNKTFVNQNIKKNTQVSDKDINIKKDKVLDFLKKASAAEDGSLDKSKKLDSTLIFIDPPYKVDNKEVNEIFEYLSTLLKDGSIIVIEREKNSGDFVVPNNMEVVKNKLYGATHVYFLEVRNS